MKIYEEGKVSIIIPAYNVQNYIEQCIESLLAQTYTNLEIIISYTKSKDDTGKKCYELSQAHNNITLLTTDYCSVSNARNMAIEASSGQYLAFVDSDDWVEKDYIETLVNAFDKNMGLSICGYDRAKKDNAGKYIYREELLSVDDRNYSHQSKPHPVDDIKTFSQEETIGYVLCNNVVGGYLWNKLFSHSVIESHNIRFKDELSVGEDMTFIAEYMQYIKGATYIPKALYHYRLNEFSILQKMYTTGKWEEKKLSNMKACDYIFEIYKNYENDCKDSFSNDCKDTFNNDCKDALNNGAKETLENSGKYRAIRKAVNYRMVRTSMWTFFNMLKCNYYDKAILLRIKGNITGRYRVYCQNENTKKLEKIVALCIRLFPCVTFRIARIGIKILPSGVIGRYLK